MKNVDDYYILLDCSATDSVVIANLPEDILDRRDINKGGRLLNSIAHPLKLVFSRNFPDNRKLYDFVSNTMNLSIVSEKVKNFFIAEKLEDLEFLPVEIVDLKEDVVGQEYYLINFLRREPIIDMEKSKCRMSSIQPLYIARIKLLHLDVENVDPDQRLFLATNELRMVFITKDLLDKMISSGITGIRALKAEGWNGNSLTSIGNIMT